MPPVVYQMDIFEFLSNAKDKFDVIMADPPWRYDIEAPRKEDRIGNHYNQMETEELCNLDIGRIANKDCYLFLWIPAPKIEEGLKVLKSWGFVYRTQMIWNKKSLGLGHILRTQHEILLIGKKRKAKASRNEIQECCE